MKQVIGEKKHKLCEQIGGRKYQVCYTQKHMHFIAECWFTTRDADYVNYKNRWCQPKIRDGKLVPTL
jgi:hypothetical protein